MKILRLRDITYKHLRKHNPKATLKDLENLETEIKIWVKNALLFAAEINAKLEVSFISDEIED